MSQRPPGLSAGINHRILQHTTNDLQAAPGSQTVPARLVLAHAAKSMGARSFAAISTRWPGCRTAPTSCPSRSRCLSATNMESLSSAWSNWHRGNSHVGLASVNLLLNKGPLPYAHRNLVACQGPFEFTRYRRSVLPVSQSSCNRPRCCSCWELKFEGWQCSEAEEDLRRGPLRVSGSLDRVVQAFCMWTAATRH